MAKAEYRNVEDGVEDRNKSVCKCDLNGLQDNSSGIFKFIDWLKDLPTSDA